MMTIVSFTSGSAPQPWDSLSSPPPPLPSGNRFGPSPLGLGTWDEQGDIISPAEKGRKDGGIWDGPTGPTKGAAAPTSLSPPHSRAPSRTGDGSNRRGSRLERVARSQGEEDSRGLVILGDLERGRETEEEEEEEGRPPVGTHPWDPNRRECSYLLWTSFRDFVLTPSCAFGRSERLGNDGQRHQNSDHPRESLLISFSFLPLVLQI